MDLRRERDGHPFKSLNLSSVPSVCVRHCGSLNVISPHNLTGSGTREGMALLEQICAVGQWSVPSLVF